jgi:hypothetical protein
MRSTQTVAVTPEPIASLVSAMTCFRSALTTACCILGLVSGMRFSQCYDKLWCSAHYLMIDMLQVK